MSECEGECMRAAECEKRVHRMLARIEGEGEGKARLPQRVDGCSWKQRAIHPLHRLDHATIPLSVSLTSAGQLVQGVGGGSGALLPVVAPVGSAARPDGGALLDPIPPISHGSRPAASQGAGVNE